MERAELERLRKFSKLREDVFYPKADLMVDDKQLQDLRQLSNENLGLTPDLVRSTAVRHFGKRLAEVSQNEKQGTFHRLFLIRLIDDSRWLLRFNILGDAWPGFALHLEAWAAGRVREAGIAAPEILTTDTSRKNCQFDYQIESVVSGKNLGEFDEDENTTLRLLKEFGATLADLHRIQLNGYGWIGIPSLEKLESANFSGVCSAWSDYLGIRLEAHVGTCEKMGAIDTKLGSRIREHFDEFFTGSKSFRASLLHGDPGSHNVMTDGVRITGLVDWEDCLSGDPIYEIAFWATFHPARRYRAFLEGYQKVNTLPADFDSRFWLYFLRVALAKTVHRRRFGYADRPGRPPASERIINGLKNLESALSGSPVAL